MNKSNINVPSAGTEVDSNSTAQNQQVSQPNANTNVGRQGGEKRDTYSVGFKRALQIVAMQVDNKIYKTKKRNPTPNTFPQAYSDGYLKALNHVKDLIESRLKKLN